MIKLTGEDLVEFNKWMNRVEIDKEGDVPESRCWDLEQFKRILTGMVIDGHSWEYDENLDPVEMVNEYIQDSLDSMEDEVIENLESRGM